MCGGKPLQRFMNTATLQTSTYGFLFAALSHAAYATLLIRFGALRNATGTAASRSLTAAIVATVLWACSGLASASLVSEIPAFLTQFFDYLRYGLWFWFLLVLIEPARARGSVSTVSSLRVTARVLIAADLLALTLDYGGIVVGASWIRLALFGILALPIFGLILVEQLFRNLDEDSRWNAKPLCLGLGVVFCFDLYLYSRAVLFGGVDGDLLSIRAGIHSLSVPFLLVASRRRADWIAKLQVSRTVAFYSASLLLAGIYLLLISAVGYYVRTFGGEWGSVLQAVGLITAITFLAVLFASRSMRARLRIFLGKHFFSYRFDYREEWLRFTSILSSGQSPQDTGTLIVKGLANMVESPAGSLWTKEPEAPEFIQAARWNTPAIDARESGSAPLPTFMAQTGWIIDVDQYRTAPEAYERLQLPGWLSGRQQLWLVIPLLLSKDLMGFVTLERPRAPMDLNWEVRDLLKTASRQAASFLAHMRATEALLEARKFDAFNRMSAFVVHDLKNIVTQLSLMMKNAERHGGNREFQQDMLSTVESSLDKMRQLMLQLREGEVAHPGRSGVELLPIIRRIEAVVVQRGRAVEVEAPEQVITRGHEQRIERVLGHVVQNALDATTPADRVWLKVKRAKGQVQIEVGDTGKGMSDEYVRHRLFKPFQTTKESGMGIGTFESLQYIRELGGNIAVDTKLNRGTVMTILLPLFERHAATDLQMTSVK
jgi:putative PEP-CTERM system histidine kinase